MVLAIDIGTTTCKAALFDRSGNLQQLAKVSVSIHSDANGAQETAPRYWSAAVATLCDELQAKGNVRSVVVSGNGPTVVPVFAEPTLFDGSLHAQTGMARLWLDRRAVVEAAEISQATGSFVDASFVLPQVLHLSRTAPATYAKTRTFLSSCEYVNYLLTGEARAILHADDALRWYWTDTVLDHFGLDKDKFPEFCRPGDLVGKVTAYASRSLGLPLGIPVFAAGPDFLVSILGCAVVEPGMVCDRSGTSEGINLCTRTPLDDDRLMTYLHPVKPFYNISGIISTSGKAIGWAKSLLGMDRLPFDDMYAAMAKAPAGSGGLVFLPYLTGERAPLWDPDAKGVFSGLTLSAGRESLLRSVAEGVCLAMRDVIAVMEELGGKVEALRITGGPSESRFLNQLKADVTGRPVAVPLIGDAELVGSMVIARTALGDYPSFADAARQLVTIGETYDPDTTLGGLYADLFERYRATYRNLRETWRK